jgi:hypothetical protein
LKSPAGVGFTPLWSILSLELVAMPMAAVPRFGTMMLPLIVPRRRPRAQVAAPSTAAPGPHQCIHDVQFKKSAVKLRRNSGVGKPFRFDGRYRLFFGSRGAQMNGQQPAALSLAVFDRLERAANADVVADLQSGSPEAVDIVSAYTQLAGPPRAERGERQEPGGGDNRAHRLWDRRDFRVAAAGAKLVEAGDDA